MSKGDRWLLEEGGDGVLEMDVTVADVAMVGAAAVGVPMEE